MSRVDDYCVHTGKKKPPKQSGKCNVVRTDQGNYDVKLLGYSSSEQVAMFYLGYYRWAYPQYKFDVITLIT